jgi:hypothetical protein
VSRREWLGKEDRLCSYHRSRPGFPASRDHRRRNTNAYADPLGNAEPDSKLYADPLGDAERDTDDYADPLGDAERDTDGYAQRDSDASNYSHCYTYT